MDLTSTKFDLLSPFKQRIPKSLFFSFASLFLFFANIFANGISRRFEIIRVLGAGRFVMILAESV